MSDELILEIIWIDDEQADIYFDDVLLININHGDHGWSGMTAIRDALVVMAHKAGIEVKVEGEEAV